MAATGQASGESGAFLNPAVWLIAPTLSLLLGQAVAAGPWALPLATAAISILPALGIAFASSRRLSLLAMVSLVACTVGYVRHRQLLYPEFSEHHLRVAMSRDERIFLEGILVAEPEKLPSRSRWLVRTERIWHPTGAEEIEGDLLVSVRTARREWRYGDRMRFWVRPAAPRDSGNPGGFNYATYLARRGIYATGFLDNDAEVELVGRNPGVLFGFVENLRREIRRFIDQNLSHDSAALLKALVVGDMGTISKETRAAFTLAGVNHVLSISGLHVAMLGLVVFGMIRYGGAASTFLLLRWNLLKIATFGSFIAVVFYTALAGAMVPTVRSAIMIGVYELAVLLDREEEVFTSLTLAALLIALVWPGVVADVSFQLSFLAVLFIVWGMRRIHAGKVNGKRDELPQEKSRLREYLRRAGHHLAVPLLATIGTGPLIAHYFGHLSLAGFIANPLIVPLVGFIVVPLGLSIGFLAVVAPELASWLIWLAEKLASLTASAVDLFARLPLANFAVPSPDPFEVAALYALLLCCFALRQPAHLLIALCIATLVLVGDGARWWSERYKRKELRVTHLNVGQGDAAVVELPNSQVLLVDAGGTATGDFDVGESIVAPYLRRRKILKVDYLFASHPRIDHYGGMGAIANEFSPHEFWSGAGKGKTGRFEDLEDLLARKKIARVALAEGDSCRLLGEVKICALTGGAEKGDDESVAIMLEHGRLRYLFASDIDKRDEGVLAQKAGALRSAVLKVPRHGNATASTPEFVAAAQPRLAVISAGARSRSESQREEIAERYRLAGAEVLRTYDDGAIIVESDGNTLRYHGYKSGKSGVIDLAAENVEIGR
ncbi:MAG TPA: DNA internalization-related competence protein ComEC/Rec2 [Terriglobales bacterium]|jgi:competence protein ComEC|nr:DNA internalization-related competence protein ComEC/Rec2 [Terriglobales bacterium]